MKRIILAILLCSMLAVFAVPPQHAWTFEKRNDSGYFLDSGSSTTPCLMSGKPSDFAGHGGGNALVCKGKMMPQGRVPMAVPNYAIQFRFKLLRPFAHGGSRGLFNYEFWSWNRRSFRIRIDRRGCLETQFKVFEEVRVPLDYHIISKPLTWETDRWYQVHLSGRKGGIVNLWLDDRLVASGRNAPGICDINDGKKHEYDHLLRLGWDTSDPRPGHGSLEGLMDDVRVWEHYVKPSDVNGSSMRKSQSRQVVIGRGKEHKTQPFEVPDQKGQAYGSFNKAAEKFVQAAATASMTIAGNHFVVRIYCPIPAGMHAVTSGKGVWTGDYIEFFLRPNPKERAYYQYCAGANGASRTFRYDSYLVEDKAFKSKAVYKVDAKAPNGFNVTINIPMAEVGCANIQDGTIMTGNFCRGGQTAGGLTSWAPMRNNFHAIDAFGKLIVGSAKAYFENQGAALQEEMDRIDGQQEMKQEMENDLSSFLTETQRNGNNPASFEKLELMLGNLRTQMVSYRLSGKPFLVWENNPWENDVVPDMHSKPVNAIRLKAAQNSRVLYGMTFSNLSPRPFLGLVKCFQQWPPKSLSKNVYCDNWSEFQSRISILEGIMLLNSGGQPMYDPMIPLPQGNILRVPAHGNTPLWLSISTKGMAPGTYRCFLVFKPSYSFFSVQTIPIELEVLPVDLGKVQLDSFHYAFFTEFPVDHPNYRHMGNLYRYLVDQEANVIFAGQLIEVYPQQNPDGTLHPIDFSCLDRKIDTYVAAGMPIDRLKLMFNLHTFIFVWRDKNGKQHPQTLEFGTPEFERGFMEFIKRLYAHLEARYKMPPERVIIYTGDEPEGDIHDPKSRLYRVNYLGRLVKTAVPRASTVTNPYPRQGVNAKFIEAIDILRKYHTHLILLPQARTEEVMALVKKKGFTLWSYAVLVNTALPSVYRQLFYTSFRDGFGSANAYWAIDSYSGDGFDANDCSGDWKGGYSQGRTDYGSAYVDGNLGTIATGRRAEAHYQGFLDYKAMTLCRKLMTGRKNHEEWQKRLDDIVARGCKGACREQEKCHLELLELIMQLQGNSTLSKPTEASMQFDRKSREYAEDEQVKLTIMLPAEKPQEYRLRHQTHTLNATPDCPWPWMVSFQVNKKPGLHNVFLERKDAKTGHYRVVNYQKYWVAPEKLTPGQGKPEDFDQFWKEQLAKERKHPFDPQLRHLPNYSKPGHYQVYAVSLHAPLGRIYGYLNIPDKKKVRFPAKMTVCWAGPGWNEPHHFSDRFVILAMNIHNFDPRNTKQAYDELNQPLRETYNCQETYMLKGMPNRNDMYYIHGIVGNVRALEWLASHPQVDPKRIGYFGTSQGGGFGFYLGGLSDKLSFIVCDVPALCDLSAYMKGRYTGFPWYTRAGKTDQIRRLCSYFDCASFAPRIQAKIRVLAGEYDEVCYPYNVRAAFNCLPKDTDAIFLTQWGGNHGGIKTLYGLQLEWLDDMLTK